jgi:hypothetical protein
MMMAEPGKKAAKQSGAYLNVWKKIDGQWKMLVEMSSPLPPPPAPKK